jgi:ATP-binding cassette subfamily C protein
MPQAAEFFDGTIAENIARMNPIRNDPSVLAAADQAGAHELILRLGGFDARIGDGGSLLSAGQRQRIALARALYGLPFLIVLDEPNANIDTEGNAALERAIALAKARGAIVIVVAHQPSAISSCDKLLVLAGGIQKEFGPTADILQRVLVKPAQLTAGQGAGLRVVTEKSSGGP